MKEHRTTALRKGGSQEERRARYREFVQGVPTVVYVDASNETSFALYMSPRAEAMLGHSPKEWPKDPGLWAKTLHPDDRERVLTEHERTRRTGKPFSVEYRLVAKDGRAVWVLDEAELPERDGESVRQGILANVTGGKEALEALRQSERRLDRQKELFRLHFEEAPVGWAHVAPDGRWIAVNKKLCEMSGYTREELSGMTFLDLLHPDDREDGREWVRRVLAGKRQKPHPVERRYIRRDRRRIWVRVSVFLMREEPSGEPERLVCSAEDVTERKLRQIVPDPLTANEMKVLHLVAQGRTSCEIARELRYSTSMIDCHVGRVNRKLGVKSRKEAVKKAIEVGLLPTPPC